MRKYLLTFVMLAACSGLFANEPQPGPELSEQFQAVRQQAEVVDGFRMLKAYQVENFWKSVQDTLRLKDEAFRQATTQIVSRDKEIKALNAAMEQKDASVEDMEFASTHISVLGLDLTKSAFTRTVFITMLVLLALIGVAFWGFKVSFRTARESRSLYDEVCRDFDAYKHRMVEKEVKLLRELQDHRNRLTELKSA